MTQPKDKKIFEELAEGWEKIAALRVQDLIDAKDSNPGLTALVWCASFLSGIHC
jgi:hypothetical protein